MSTTDIDTTPRSYNVGLPVTITVEDSGRVTYEIDTSEATLAIDEAQTEMPIDDQPDTETFVADLDRIGLDHQRRHDVAVHGHTEETLADAITDLLKAATRLSAAEVADAITQGVKNAVAETVDESAIVNTPNADLAVTAIDVETLADAFGGAAADYAR